MANTSHGFYLAMTLVDAGEKPSVVTLQMTATTYSQAIGAAPTIVAAYQAISKSIVVGFHVLEKWSVDGADPSTAVSFNVIKAKITANVDGNPLKNVSLSVVNPVDGIFSGAPGTGGYDIVDVADGALTTYLDFFRAAATTAGLFVSDGELIDVVLRGRRAP
jgi:hypothetical protein